jgi:hypothetical protein
MRNQKFYLTLMIVLLLVQNGFAQNDIRKARNEIRNAKSGVRDAKQITNDVKSIANDIKGSKKKEGTSNEDEPKKSAAKTYYKLFWKHVEKGELSQAENDLKNLKKVEPEYNTAEMEKVLEDLRNEKAGKAEEKAQEKQKIKDEKEAEQNAKKEANDAKEQAKGKNRDAASGYANLLNDLFDISSASMTVGESELELRTKNLENYKSKIQQMEATPTNSGEKMFDGMVENYERRVGKKYDYEITAATYKKLAEDIKIAGTPGNAKAIYTTLLFQQAYWEAASKCVAFKRKEEYAKLYQSITATVNGVGGMEGAANLAQKGEENRLKNVKMPAALTTNATMDKEFRKAFEQTGWGETILKVNLLDTDWHIERNELTGVILSRYQSAAIAAKQSNGRCMLYTFTIKQEYNGSGYGSSRRDSHNSNQIACENVK